MKKIFSFVMIVLGVGVFVLGVSDYSPGSGWSDACRHVMAVGSMLATSGWLLR